MRIELVLFLLFFLSCGTNNAPDASADPASLAEAEALPMPTLSSPQLRQRVEQTGEVLQVFFFWDVQKDGFQKSLEALATLQAEADPSVLQITTVHLGTAKKEVVELLNAQPALSQNFQMEAGAGINAFVPEFGGTFPLLLIVNQDASLRQAYRQNFDYETLSDLLLKLDF